MLAARARDALPRPRGVSHHHAPEGDQTHHQTQEGEMTEERYAAGFEDEMAEADGPLSEAETAAVAQAVEAAVAAAEAARPDGTIVLSSGAVVRPLEVPDALIQKLWMQFPEPSPPQVTITEGSKTWKQANPDDPDYQRALQRRTLQIGEGMFRIMAIKAMEIVALPPGVDPYAEDMVWADELEALGFEVPAVGLSRYLEWLRDRILPRSSDLDALQSACMALAGISEEEVDAAVARFQRPRGRDAH